MSKQIIPNQDRIIVKKFQEPTHSKGGLYLPEKHSEGTYQGEVLYVGPGKINKNGDRIPGQIRVGDIVCFTRIAGVMHTIEGKDLVVMKEEDVSAIIREVK
jgi:chaperonin GroES